MLHGHRRSVVIRLLGLGLAAALLSSVAVAQAAVVSPPAQSISRQASAAQPCDPIQPSSHCLLPFPDDYFTRPDPANPTGLAVNLPIAAMPKNAQGVPIDPGAWTQSDGFSPGSEIVTQVAGLDLTTTGAAPVTDPGASLRPDAPIAIIDARTGSRHPLWAELDANAQNNPSQQALILRPAVNFTMGHRYIVALRELRTSGRAVIPANPAFAALRDAACHGRHPGRLPMPLAGQVPRMRRIFSELSKAHVGCRDLYLAWDFTVASAANVTGRLLHIRDDAFAKLRSGAPHFTVTSAVNFTPAQNPNLARQVVGTFDVPSYLDQPGGPPGSQFNFKGSPDGAPTQLPGNIQVANFICDIPRAVVADGSSSIDTVYPGHASLYGHGLLGSADEVNAFDVKQTANSYDFVFCATDEIGQASQDIPTTIGIFQNFSLFPTIPDRLQQALLNELFLGRLMTSPSGFVSSPAFRGGAGNQPLIDTSALYYLGYSQGGILGGALTAVSQSFTRAVLGVPGMNYSTLIDRSSDAAPFLGLLNQTYPDKLDQQLIFSLIQMLWDRGEPDGYAQFMTDHALPGTPRHQVLLEAAFGDHQVANVTTAVEARTIGAEVYRPAVPPGLVTYDPFWNVPPVSSGDRGSAVVMWDTPGVPPPPLTDTPPTAGKDPHENPRLTPASQLQEATFLLTGRFLDTCGGAPCLAPQASPGIS